MPTHHFEFYASFLFHALVTCSVLWCVVYVIFSCGKHIHKRPCLSVSLSVRPSVPAFASTFHDRLPCYFIIWLETPTACGSQIFKVLWQISRSHRPKNLMKRVKLRVFGHFLENAWGKGLKYRMLMYPDYLIKSPRYTVGDFIFLYRFARRRRHRPQILVHAITFEQLFRFLSFFDDCWPWPIDYLIRFWSILVVTLTLNFQGQIWNLLYLSQKWSDCHETKSKHIDWTLDLKCDHRVWPWPWPWLWLFKVKYGICYISAKNGAIATKRKADISIDVNASNVTIEFDLGHDLDLEFSRSNVEFAISLPKMVWLPRNEKQTYRLNPETQMRPLALTLAITLTLNFQGQIWNLLYLNEKWSDCYETKSKISIELQVSNVTNGFDLDHDLDIWIFKVKCDLDHLVTKVRRKDLPDRDRGDFGYRRAVDSSS